MSEADRHVESVLSALALLECFERDQALRLEDFHARTGLTRSRIIRLAGTLVHKGYLVHDRPNAQYRLGPTLFRLSSLLNDRYGTIAKNVRPILKELVTTTGLTAMFSVIGGVDRLILAKEEPDEAVRYTVQEGQARPIGLGASGRVLLAFSKGAIASELVDRTQLSDPAKAALFGDLEQVRKKGFGLSESELTRHAFAVAVPVLTQDGALLGALTVAGPTLEYREDSLDNLVSLLKRQAGHLQFAEPQSSAETNP